MLAYQNKSHCKTIINMLALRVLRNKLNNKNLPMLIEKQKKKTKKLKIKEKIV